MSSFWEYLSFIRFITSGSTIQWRINQVSCMAQMTSLVCFPGHGWLPNNSSASCRNQWSVTARSLTWDHPSATCSKAPKVKEARLHRLWKPSKFRKCKKGEIMGVTRGGKGGTMTRAPKSPNNVASTFFNTVNLLPKDLGSNMGGPSNHSTPLGEMDASQDSGVKAAVSLELKNKKPVQICHRNPNGFAF